MNEKFIDRLRTEIEEIKESGLFKNERTIASPQGAEITVSEKQVLNFCANNYLGLSSHPKIPSCMRRHLMPMAVYLNPCLTSRMQSFPTP
jgi:glycine C-acetyltransferase